MLAYVLDGNIPRAMTNVEANIGHHHSTLGMALPGKFARSTAIADHTRARETQHQRAHESILFRIHHLFMAAKRPPQAA
jgi:hypothetical protein